jgi:hypothetical protein
MGPVRTCTLKAGRIIVHGFMVAAWCLASGARGACFVSTPNLCENDVVTAIYAGNVTALNPATPPCIEKLRFVRGEGWQKWQPMRGRPANCCQDSGLRAAGAYGPSLLGEPRRKRTAACWRLVMGLQRWVAVWVGRCRQTSPATLHGFWHSWYCANKSRSCICHAQEVHTQGEVTTSIVA